MTKKQIADYHKYHRLVREGDFYRLVSPTENDFYCAWEFVSPDKQEAMMTAVVMRQPETRYCVQRLRGLDPKTYYQDEETGTVYSGAMLMNAGLNLTRDVYEDGTSVTKHFKAVK